LVGLTPEACGFISQFFTLRWKLTVFFCSCKHHGCAEQRSGPIKGLNGNEKKPQPSIVYIANLFCITEKIKTNFGNKTGIKNNGFCINFNEGQTN